MLAQCKGHSTYSTEHSSSPSDLCETKGKVHIPLAASLLVDVSCCTKNRKILIMRLRCKARFWVNWCWKPHLVSSSYCYCLEGKAIQLLIGHYLLLTWVFTFVLKCLMSFLMNSILVSCAPTGPKTIWSEHCKINEQLCQAAEQLCGFLGLRAPASVRLLPCFCFLFSFPAGALFQISSCAAWPVTVSLEFPTLSSNAELWAAKK